MLACFSHRTGPLVDDRAHGRVRCAILRVMARVRHRWDPVCDPPTGLVRPVPLDPTGASGPTRGQARGPRWRQSTHGLYVPSEVPLVPEQRVLEQSMLLPSGGAVTGWAALRMLRANFFDGVEPDGVTRRPVPLVTGPEVHRRDRGEVTFCRDRIAADEVVRRYGVPCTIPERATFDEMRKSGDLRAAVTALDMAAAGEVTSLRRMGRYVDAHPGWQGVELARSALGLADEHSLSPRETELRLIWVLDARRPRPLANRAVFDRRTGRLLGYADLLDPEAGVVGEFDGGEHAGTRRRSRDAGRDVSFRDHGLEVFRVTSLDLLDRRTVLHRIESSYHRAQHVPRDRRTWTLEPPPGWEPAPSLDELLDTRDALREMHEQMERLPVGPAA